MIDNPVRANSLAPQVSELAGKPRPSANTTAFESLMSALASEARVQNTRPAAPLKHVSGANAAAPTRGNTQEQLRREDVTPTNREKVNRPKDAPRNERAEKTPPRPERVDRKRDDAPKVDNAPTKTEKAAKSDKTENTAPTQTVKDTQPHESGGETPQVAQADTPALLVEAIVAQDTEAPAQGSDETMETTGIVQPAEQELAGAEEVPVDVKTQEALSGEVPPEEKAPALDGKTLVQDLKQQDSTKTTTLPQAVKLGEAPASPIPAGDAEVAPALVEDLPTAVAQVAAMAGQAAAVSSGETVATSTATASTPAVTGVGGTASATATLAPAAPAQAPAQASANAVAQTAPTYAPNLSQQLFDQMQHQLSRLRSLGEGLHQLKLAIKPEAFGPVRVAANFHADGTVQLQLLGANDAARDQLRQVLADLRRDLAATGLTAQLDLADSTQEFAQFTGAGQNDGNQDNSQSGNGLPSPEGRENKTEKENSVSTPRVGDVLKDGSDGTVDMFA